MKSTVTVIGAGPAGLSASIQLSRFRIAHFIFEKFLPGGLVRNGNQIENYPGIFTPVSGEELADRFIQHFNVYGQNIIRSGVDRIEFEKDHDRFRITAGKSDYYSDYVIAASGTKPVIPDIPGRISDGLGKVIHYEITGIRTVSGKRILIAGAGDCAFDYSLSLSVSNEVDIINRGKIIKALPLLIDRIMNVPGISYSENTVIRKMESGAMKPLKIGLVRKGKEYSVEYDLAVFAVGRRPSNDYLVEIPVDVLERLVKKERLIYAGDITNGVFRQAVIATGDGIRSAMKINRSLNEDNDGSRL